MKQSTGIQSTLMGTIYSGWALLAFAVLMLAGGTAHAKLTHHWKFDESSGTTAADSAGNLDLALQGDAQFTNDTTRGGQVLALDGDGDYAMNPGEPFTSDTNHTVALWVNHFDEEPSQRWISWGGPVWPEPRYFMGPHHSANGRIQWQLGNTVGAFFAPAVPPLQNTWQHYALVREGTAARLYLNGDLIHTITIDDGGSIPAAGELRIGRQYGTITSEDLHGRMDDLAIWNIALDEQQIRNAMNLGAEYAIPPSGTVFILR